MSNKKKITPCLRSFLANCFLVPFTVCVSHFVFLLFSFLRDFSHTQINFYKFLGFLPPIRPAISQAVFHTIAISSCLVPTFLATFHFSMDAATHFQPLGSFPSSQKSNKNTLALSSTLCYSRPISSFVVVLLLRFLSIKCYFLSFAYLIFIDSAHQTLPSMEFSKQETSGLPFPSPVNLPNLGIEPWSPAFQADALPSDPPGNPDHVVGAMTHV